MRYLFAAVLAASLLTASTADAFIYSVWALQTPTDPERLMCDKNIDAAGPAQAVVACLRRFGWVTSGWAATPFCLKYRSTYRTRHKDGTTPEWEYRIAQPPPYPNYCY